MSTQPANPRGVTFIDGQNLFRAVKDAFKYTFPNYDVRALSSALCAARGWTLAEVRFYTGVPDRSDNPFWHGFWSNKRSISTALNARPSRSGWARKGALTSGWGLT